MVMYRESRELVQNAVVLTSDRVDEHAKQWRHCVAARVCMLLRVAMGVIDYCEHHVNVWDLEEVNDDDRAEIFKFLYMDVHNGSPTASKWAHGERTEFEENMRVPICLAYLLRKELHYHRSQLAKPLEVPQELKLLASIDNFMIGYHG